MSNRRKEKQTHVRVFVSDKNLIKRLKRKLKLPEAETMKILINRVTRRKRK